MINKISKQRQTTRKRKGKGIGTGLGKTAGRGHKGQKSEERAWKGLREHLTRGEGSFTFEYSATFGQIITNDVSEWHKTCAEAFHKYSQTNNNCYKAEAKGNGRVNWVS